MALPKRKISKTRGRKRRTHWVAKAPQVGTCSQCKCQVSKGGGEILSTEISHM